MLSSESLGPDNSEEPVTVRVQSGSVEKPSAEAVKEANVVDLDQFDDEEYVINIDIPKSSLLPGHRSKEDFTFTEVKTNNTAHVVHRVLDKENKEYFLKINSPGAIISLLEKTAADFYRILAPSYIAPTFAVYDKDTCIGVASEAIPNFKAYAEDKLKESDLDLSFMEEKDLSIETLDQLEEELHQLEMDDFDLLRQLKIETENDKEIQKLMEEFLEEDGYFLVPENEEAKDDSAKKLVKENQPKNEFRQNLENLAVKYNLFQPINGQVQDHSIPDDELLKKINRANAAKKLDLEDKRIDLVKKKNEFKKKLDTQYNKLTLEELNKYRIIKGLAICFAVSYIFTEDDLHAYNFSKYGKRLDFDMSLYDKLMYKAKNQDDLLLNLVDMVDLVKFIKLRAPNDKTCIVTSYDIDNLPDIQDREVTFWPTVESVILGSNAKWFRYIVMRTATTVKSGLNMRINNYTPEDNALFKKLKNIGVYRHHSFFTIAKYILTNADIFHQVASNDIPESSEYILNGVKRNVINHLVNTQKSTIDDFLNKFLDVPGFADFFIKNHEAIAAQLLKTLDQQNLQYSYNNEAKENEAKSTPADQVKKRCEHILKLIEQKKKLAPNHSMKAPVCLAAMFASPQETKEQAPTPSELYNKIDEMIRNQMTIYSGRTSMWTAFTTFGGLFRTHGALATKIISECDTLKTDLKVNQNTDPEIYVAAIKKLNSVIIVELEPLETAHKKKLEENIKEEPGEMHKELLSLKESIQKMVPQEMLNAAPEVTATKSPSEVH